MVKPILLPERTFGKRFFSTKCEYLKISRYFKNKFVLIKCDVTFDRSLEKKKKKN